MKSLILLVSIGLLFVKSMQAQDSLAHYSLAQLDSIYKKKKGKDRLPYALAMHKKAEKELPPQDTALASILFKLGYSYSLVNNYDSALFYAQESAKIYEAKASKATNYAAILEFLANQLGANGEIAKALAYGEKLVALQKNNFGEEHLEYAKALRTLAVLKIERMADYKETLPVLLKILEIRKKQLGEEHHLYAESLRDLMIVYNRSGEYEKALPLSIKLLENQEKNWGKTHALYAAALNSVGLLYRDIGLYDKASELLSRVVAICAETYGKDKQQYGFALDNLALVYRDLNLYEKALPLHLEALSIYKKTGLKDYSISLTGLGNLYVAMKEYEKALPILSEVVELRQTLLGSQHPLYADALHNLCGVYKKMGNYEKALPLSLAAWEIRKKIGKQLTYYAQSLASLAENYEILGDYKKSQSFHSLLIDFQLDKLDKTSAYLGEREKQDFFNTLAGMLNNVYSFAAFHRINDSLLIQMQDGLLLTKGYALAGVSELLPLIKSLKDSTLNTTYLAWTYTKKQLGKAYEMTIAERTTKGINIDSLQRLAGEQESIIMHGSAALKERLGYDKKRFYFNDLVATLDKNEVAIDFVRFENEKKDTAWYYALVSQQGWAFPKFIPLCTEKDLEQYALADIQPNEQNYITKTAWSQALYNLVIKPLEPYLQKKKIIHWSPVGLLNQVALGTLRNTKNKLFSERFELHQYGAMKDFIVIKQAEKEGKMGMNNSKINNVLLVGDVTFDLEEAEHTALTQGVVDADLYVSRAAPTDSTRSSSRFTRLAGTKVELESLSKAFNSKKWKIDELQQKQALEERVREFSGEKAPLVLHFATHGFFIPAKKQGEDNPLLRSGIALAGANRVWMGKERIDGVEDGLWTAYEVANSNLMLTNLVVLSACETARGQIDPHEGVVGLQRSFKIAGVENMLLSLWQVPDKETVELMQEFYKHYLNGEKPSVALRKAQETMRKAHPEPYYWAAFILIE